MSEQITISGDRYQVSQNAWANWVGDNTIDEFMQGYDSADDAISAYVKQIPQIFGCDVPVFFWTEMNSEYTLAELLERYIEGR